MLIGNDSFETTGYVDYVRDYSNYSAPFIFTEYGCNKVLPRIFREVDSIYGPNMDNFLSGGFVYEWSQEDNNYGLVNISTDGTTLTLTTDYNNLKARLANINPDRTNLTSYNGSTSTVNACPTYRAGTFNSQSYPLPPTPNDTVCSCLNSQLACTTLFQNATQANANATYAGYIAQDVNYVCSRNASFCEAVSSNPTTGTYGLYSGCNSLQRAAYVLNQWYQANKNVGNQGDAACTGFPSAKLVTPSSTCANGVVAPTNAPAASGSNSATGATGNNGATGTSSTNGATGTTGNNGATGTTGNNGATGTTGNNGATGTTGNNGATGSNTNGGNTTGSARFVIPLVGLVFAAVAAAL